MNGVEKGQNLGTGSANVGAGPVAATTAVGRPPSLGYSAADPRSSERRTRTISRDVGTPPTRRGTPAASATLRFNIERLTLPGMSRADTTRVVEAMKQGLAKLANRFPGRNWQGLSAIDRLDGGTIRAGAKPEQIGEHLATQIFRRLSS